VSRTAGKPNAVSSESFQIVLPGTSFAAPVIDRAVPSTVSPSFRQTSFEQPNVREAAAQRPSYSFRSFMFDLDDRVLDFILFRKIYSFMPPDLKSGV